MEFVSSIELPQGVLDDTTHIQQARVYNRRHRTTILERRNLIKPPSPFCQICSRVPERPYGQGKARSFFRPTFPHGQTERSQAICLLTFQCVQPLALAGTTDRLAARLGEAQIPLKMALADAYSLP